MTSRYRPRWEIYRAEVGRVSTIVGTDKIKISEESTFSFAVAVAVPTAECTQVVRSGCHYCQSVQFQCDARLCKEAGKWRDLFVFVGAVERGVYLDICVKLSDCALKYFAQQEMYLYWLCFQWEGNLECDILLNLD